MSLSQRTTALLRRLRPPKGAGADDGPEAWRRFDADWYLLAYPELRDTVRPAGARAHFERVGAASGRDPNPFFSERWYRGFYPDVAAALAAGTYRTGFEHFAASGYAEGRRPNGLWVDEAWYQNRYSDVLPQLGAAPLRSAYEHYVYRGAALGRDPHPVFAEGWYRKQHPDVASAVAAGRYLCGYQQFLERGRAEGRRPHPQWDDEHYLELNPDVRAALASGGVEDAYRHLVTQGLAEGRPWRRDDEAELLRKSASEVARAALADFLASGDRLRFDSGDRPDASVLLVLYNRAELTYRCLEALLASRGPRLEVVIVDNASRDATGELLARVEGAVVLRNDENVGFTRATNQAAAAARGETLLLLNNDTEVFPRSVEAALARLRSTPDAGAVGGRVIGLDGRLQEAGSVVWRDASTDGYGRGDDPTSGAYLFPREVDYVSGVFLLTRRSTWQEMGGLDLAFTPAYYEETDYCFRLRRRGLRILYEPRATLLHFGSASLPDDAVLNRMLAANRPKFLARYREELASAPPPDVAHFFLASDRRAYRGRVLVVDDFVPLEAVGSGAPRMQEILHALAELGYFVTVFATCPLPPDPEARRRELPAEGIEVIEHLGRGHFEAFYQPRRGSYDVVVVSRPHNLRELLDAGFDPASEPGRVVYDAEAVVSRRHALRLAILGAESPEEGAVEEADELALAGRVREIWSVTAEEGALLAAAGQRLSIVPLGAHGSPGRKAFDERRGLLFVGRLDEPWNPNVDALRWYLEEIHPRVAACLGDVGLTVVGDAGAHELPRPAGVRFLGRVRDLEPLYDAHRVFVAPTRFAAGVPQKVVAAAAQGLPVVATSLLVRQLGWQAGGELEDGGDRDPERFADRVAALYGDPERWRRLREGALARVEREHSREAMKEALRRALTPAGDG